MSYDGENPLGTTGTAGAGNTNKSKQEVWWKGKWIRQFLGKVKDFDSKEERRLEQKHLKAYIKGNKYFADGFTEERHPFTGRRLPNLIEVKQLLTKIK